jgi:hypothetical protein
LDLRDERYFARDTALQRPPPAAVVPRPPIGPADYMTAPAGRINGLESVLTLVGGRVVYAGGAHARYEGAAP